MNKDNTIFIYGKNAVLSALQNRPDTVERLFIERGKNFEQEYEKPLFEAINKSGIKKEVFVPNDLNKELQTARHQGILAKVFIDNLTVELEYFLDNLTIDQNTCLVLLGELEDIQNVGSIIRSSTALGISGVLIPEHNQAQINGAVVKVSAGTAFSIPLVKIGNVNQAIEKLKKKGFWVYGLDMFGEKSIFEESFTEPTCFIVGAEGNGLREKTKEHCDMILNIPISEKAESLNAAVSTALTMYEWRRQRLSK
jgi:23S rRNA (guanosine2251-2'-O)-methyltransferase